MLPVAANHTRLLTGVYQSVYIHTNFDFNGQYERRQLQLSPEAIARRLTLASYDHGAEFFKRGYGRNV